MSKKDLLKEIKDLISEIEGVKIKTVKEKKINKTEKLLSKLENKVKERKNIKPKTKKELLKDINQLLKDINDTKIINTKDNTKEINKLITDAEDIFDLYDDSYLIDEYNEGKTKQELRKEYNAFLTKEYQNSEKQYINSLKSYLDKERWKTSTTKEKQNMCSDLQGLINLYERIKRRTFTKYKNIYEALNIEEIPEHMANYVLKRCKEGEYPDWFINALNFQIKKKTQVKKPLIVAEKQIKEKPKKENNWTSHVLKMFEQDINKQPTKKEITKKEEYKKEEYPPREEVLKKEQNYIKFIKPFLNYEYYKKATAKNKDKLFKMFSDFLKFYEVVRYYPLSNAPQYTYVAAALNMSGGLPKYMKDSILNNYKEIYPAWYIEILQNKK